jgi:AcrR family transcriptional regulator
MTGARDSGSAPGALPLSPAKPRRADGNGLSARSAKARLKRTEGLRSEELLEAALKLFSKEGYRDVTIKRIADRLQVRHSLVYYYFDSKESLFQAALMHAIDKVTVQYERVAQVYGDPVRRIEAWFQINIELEPLLKGLINIMIDHSSFETRKRPQFVERGVREFYALEKRILAECIEEGVKAGVFECSSPSEMAEFISRGIDGVYYGAIVRRDTSITDAMNQLEVHVRSLLNARRDDGKER